MKKVLKIIGIGAAIFAYTEFIGACGEAQVVAGLTSDDFNVLGRLSEINKYVAEHPDELNKVSTYAKMKCRFIEWTARLLKERGF